MLPAPCSVNQKLLYKIKYIHFKKNLLITKKIIPMLSKRPLPTRSRCSRDSWPRLSPAEPLASRHAAHTCRNRGAALASVSRNRVGRLGHHSPHLYDLVQPPAVNTSGGGLQGRNSHVVESAIQHPHGTCAHTWVHGRTRVSVSASSPTP